MSDTETQIITHESTSPLTRLAKTHGVDPKTMEAMLFDTVFPEGMSRVDAAAFMAVADRYGLDPIRRQIYAFKGQGGRIVPIVGLDGWADLVARDGNCDGYTFREQNDDAGNVVAITCRMHVKGRSCPTEVTEYLSECTRGTPLRRTMPRRMLRHRAFIQCARIVFGFSGIYDEDEGRDIANGTHQTEAIRQKQVEASRQLVDQAAAQPATEAVEAEVLDEKREEWTPITVETYEAIEGKRGFLRWRIVDSEGVEYHCPDRAIEPVLELAKSGVQVEAVLSKREGQPDLVVRIAEVQ